MSRLVPFLMLVALGCGGRRARPVEHDDLPGARAGASTRAADAPTYTDDEVETMFASLRDGIDSCMPFSASTFTVAWSTNGSLGASVPLGEGSTIETCIRHVVARLAIDPPPTAGVVEYVIVTR